LNPLINVLFFGDSICVGQYVSIHKGWVTRTSALLAELGKKIGRTIIVTNSSANGRTTRQALEHMPYEVQSKDVDIMIVQFGMNDCNYWQSDRGIPRVSPRAFAANLHEIIARGFHFGMEKILINSNHPTGLESDLMPHANISYQESNEQYNAIIREVAANCGPSVTLNEIETVFKKYAGGDRKRLEELLLPAPDLLHLSKKGHDLYFETVYPKVEQAVLEISGTSRE
jgi:lysophospholipase L1-like esterase